MLKSLTFGGSLVLLASAATAQQQMQARPVPSQLKDAGVYHLATGTWSRGEATTGAGTKVLYTNSANTGFFGVMGVAADIIWTDEGRIPSTSGHPNGKADSYIVEQMRIAYCSSVVGPQNGGILFFDCYTSCTDILALSPIFAAGFVVPGGAGGTACWLVTFDITGTSLEFKISGDCDGSFDGTSALDNFGWTILLNDQGSGGFNGPFLNGDPNNFAYGDGTYYQNPGATYATGLGTADQFWLNDTSGSYANGCYWFGGYPGGNPFSSFWLDLLGRNQSDNGTKYCTANSNSAGGPADIELVAETPFVQIRSLPVPNQPGIFFYANNQNQVPFGCSFLCATGGTVRGAVVNGSGNVATYTYDGSDSKHTLPSGQTKNFQYWYRDPMNTANCGGASFNTSNAITIAIP